MSLRACRECGKEISTKAIACPQCGATQSVSRKIQVILAILSGIGISAILIGVLSRHQVVEPQKTPEQTVIDELLAHPDGELAWFVMSKRLIVRALVSPKSAEFAPPLEWSYERIDDRTKRIESWVDSQNALGVMLRDSFKAIITHHEDETWTVDYLKFDSWSKPIGKWRQTPAELAEVARDNELRERDERYWRANEQKKIDDRDRAAAAAKEVAERKAQAAAAADRQRREQDFNNRQQLSSEEEKRRKRQAAFERADYHSWIALGGRKKVSEARITNYDSEHGTITVTTRDGRQKRLKLSDLGNADREYADEFVRKLP